MQSLINDPSIAKYRQLEIEEGTKIAEDLLRKDKPDVVFIQGALFMLKKCLHLPLKFAKSKESKEMATNMVKKDLKEFTAHYMKLFLE